MNRSGVRSLVMGGQACVLYGGAEFSRDLDLAVDDSPDNLELLRRALEELQAERIAVPPFSSENLRMGLSVHFRCRRQDVEGLRIDVMTVMRGVDPFAELWERRTTLELQDLRVELLGLPDLVQAKKTQRDKDWPMIKRLVEAHYFTHRQAPTQQQIAFWFMEARSPSLLLELADDYPLQARTLLSERPLVGFAIETDEAALVQALQAEEQAERERDREYWEPLRKELERLRHEERKRR